MKEIEVLEAERAKEEAELKAAHEKERKHALYLEKQREKLQEFRSK